MPYLIFALLGYVSGSILYSRLLPSHFRNADIRLISDDGNPGAGNVFKNFGAALGVPCLACDILKGTIPVSLCLQCLEWDHPLFALVMATPVLGHAKKGKAIAVSFGVLIGLLPFSMMVFYLVIPFLCFSIFLRINPHAWRVIASFLCFFAASLAYVPLFSLQLGAFLITFTVIVKHIAFIRQTHAKIHFTVGWHPSRPRSRRN